jgi:transcriptional regulator with XRE-family HTH domain
MSVGQRLKELREAAGLTLEEAGVIAGTSKQSASQIEKGTTKVPGGLFLYRWSKHYGVDLEWLITGKGDPLQSHSQFARLDGDTLRNGITLVRDVLKANNVQVFDVLEDADVVVQAMRYVVVHRLTSITPTNVLDFMQARAERANERTSRDGQVDRHVGAEGSPKTGKQNRA